MLRNSLAFPTDKNEQYLKNEPAEFQIMILNG